MHSGHKGSQDILKEIKKNCESLSERALEDSIASEGDTVEYVIAGDKIVSEDRHLIGGKSMGLVRLGKIPQVVVPSWSCVTARAYRAFASKARVQEIITQLSSADNNKRAQQELWRNLLVETIPDAVAREVERVAVDLLSVRGALAVRSSAVDEDLHGQSFAGQYDTVLDVRTPVETLAAVRKCWASLWSPRAIEYRERSLSFDTRAQMAVVLQVMLEPNVSGILFTENPIEKNSSEILINAVRGLGESAVSGTATPEQWRIRRGTRAVVAHLREPNAPDQVLSMDQVLQLTRLAGNLHGAFGPSDVEWAFEGSKLYVLQVRPITGTGPHRTKAHFDAPPGSWTRFMFGEWFQSPLTPLSTTLLLPRITDATNTLLEQRLGVRFPSPTWTAVEGYYYVTSRLPRSLKLLTFPFRFVHDLNCADVLWTDHFLPAHLKQIDEAKSFDVDGASPEDLRAFLIRMSELNAIAAAWIIHSAIFAKATEVVFRVLFRILNSKGSAVFLLAGYPNKSVEADEELWCLAKEACAEPKLIKALSESNPLSALGELDQATARLWLQKVEGWISKYGHRVYDLDLARETLQDDPHLVFDLIQRFASTSGPSPLERQQQAAQHRHKAENEFVEWTRPRPIRRILLGTVLQLAQRYARIRESRPFYFHLGWPIMRRAALRLGAYLRESGVINVASDVFFLSVDQLTASIKSRTSRASSFGSEVKVQVCEARALWRWRQSLVPPENLRAPLYLRLIQHVLTKRYVSDPTTLRGVPASPGRKSGSACVLTDQSSWHNFRKGDVLVAELTTPAWTLLFGLASAIVTEKGGSLSHVAIVAREYGIPAVVGVPDLLNKVRDGMTVTVDGDAGVIHLNNAEAKVT